MSADEKVDIEKLTQEVQQEIDNDAHTKIARLCRTVLASKPDELLWLRLLCCAMIHQSHTRALLQLIESYAEEKTSVYNALLFYKLYCLYLLKENESAHALLEQLSATPSMSRSLTSPEKVAIRHLRFQILYRLARYSEALQVLDAIKNDDSRHSLEVAVNRISTYIAMQTPANAIAEFYSANIDSRLACNCDFVFNLSTALIINGQTEQALTFLLASHTKCETAMKTAEEYDDDEIAAEIGNLRLLIAYCYHERGETEKAADIYRTLIDDKVIHGVYQNLVLQNNALAVGLEPADEQKTNVSENVSDSKKKNQKPKQVLDPKLLLYKRLLCGKNTDNFSRIAVDKSGVDFWLKTYHNKAVIASRLSQETVFKAVIGYIRHEHPSSEIPIFLRVAHWYRQGRYLQCRDVLCHHLALHPNDASPQSRLMYIQSLVMVKKYRDAIKQLRLLPDEVRLAQPKMMRILLCLSDKVGDHLLTIEITKECISFLRKSRQNQDLLTSLQIKICRLMMAKNQAAEAKEIALSLVHLDPANSTYQAMVLLAAIHAKDMTLAEKMSAGLKIETGDDVSVDEMLSKVPSVSTAADDAEHKSLEAAPMKLSFEFTEESVLQRKRELTRRKRAKVAAKIRQKYKEHPELYKEAVDWRSKKVKEREKRQEENKDVKTKTKTSLKQKKSKGFKGAQGGSGTSDHYQVFDVGDPRNKKVGKQSIPEHIKKRKR